VKISKEDGIAHVKKDTLAMGHFAMTLMNALKEVIRAPNTPFVRMKQEALLAPANLASLETV
jgi:hypothetical protein